MSKPPRRKDPAPAEEAASLVDYPISAWILRSSAQTFHTVTVRLDSGQYLSVIDIDQNIRHTAPTKSAAEAGAIKALARKSNPVEDDDTADIALMESRTGEPRTSWSEVKAQMRRRRNVGR